MDKADKLYVAFCLVISVFNIADGCIENHVHTKAQQSLRELTEMNAQMLLQIEEIGRDIESMKNPRKVEHIIRDELGYGRKNDLTLVF